jgi:phosphoribosyl-ATP pyrophosphohydrolase/phosphoribosyl-AMP cyclohydrolase
MIIPSIDMQNGETVQLIGGRRKALTAGDPLPLARRFARVGEVAVIDLDAALGGTNQTPNAAKIRSLLREAPCRVGGGIRDLQSARAWLDSGAQKIIIGTAATEELLSALPAERVIVALDARDGEIVVEGWRRATGQAVAERMQQLRGLCGGFLVTLVEQEGRMTGLEPGQVRHLKEAAGLARLTVAGGLSNAAEVGALDAIGCDVQVGMALYTGQLDLADAFLAPMTNRLGQDLQGGPWPTVVCDEQGVALGLVWSDRESVRHALETGRGVYHSRRRGLWIKGEESGAHQDLLRVDLDCDRDALRFTVRQHGPGFCHLDCRTCWGEDAGVPRLARRLQDRAGSSQPGSYTARLLADQELLKAKLLEEAGELADARDPDHVAAEAADVLYFTLCALARAGVPWEQVGRHLDRRALKVTRRPGEAKRKEAGS